MASLRAALAASEVKEFVVDMGPMTNNQILVRNPSFHGPYVGRLALTKATLHGKAVWLYLYMQSSTYGVAKLVAIPYAHPVRVLTAATLRCHADHMRVFHRYNEQAPTMLLDMASAMRINNHGCMTSATTKSASIVGAASLGHVAVIALAPYRTCRARQR